MESETLDRLRDLASGNMTAKLVYKKPGQDFHSDRIVEPYSLSISGSNLIVFTWQLEPALDEPSWRNFRLDRIAKLTSGGRPFSPRIPVTLHLGEVAQFRMDDDPAHSVPSAITHAERYYRCLESITMDLRITKKEMAEATELGAKLSEERKRAIHAQVFSNFIAEVCMDGELSEHEAKLLDNVRGFLGKLGWSP